MQKKIPYLYTLRLSAIVLVILLHCISDYTMNAAYFGMRSWKIFVVLNEFGRAGVPLFLMISGFLMLSNPKTENIREFYRKRLPRILIPLAVWNLIYYFYGVAANGVELSFKEFFSEVLKSGTAYHLWFVYMLCGIYLITPFLKRLVDKCSTRALLLFFTIVIFAGTVRPLINTVTPLYVYLAEPLFENYIGYYVLGYILGKTELTRRARLILYGAGLIGLALGVCGNFIASSDKINLIFNYGYSLNHYLLATGIFVLSKYLPVCRSKKSIRVVSGASECIFGVYFVHVIVESELSKLISNYFSPVMSALTVFLATTVLSFSVAFILSKIKVVNKYIM